MAAIGLFHAGHLQGRDSARFDYSQGRFASVVFVRKIVGRIVPANNLEITSEPSAVYTSDPELGYDFVPGPGAFRTELKRTGRAHLAPFTIVDGEGRATGYQANPQEKGIWIFGDSVVFGGGNPDEHSLAWLLQARYPDWQVRNLATPGHGNVQSLIRLRDAAADVAPGDILVWGYGDYLNHRNTPAPSLVNIYNAETFEKLHPEGLKLPLATLGNDGLQIELVRMSCEGQEEWCQQGDPPFEEQARVTSALLEAFASETDATTVVAFVEGADEDPVIASARDLGIAVIDLRPDPGLNQSDDFYPFDTHPGPISHYNFFMKLSDGLKQNGLIATD